jgi:hypothetical protein
MDAMDGHKRLSTAAVIGVASFLGLLVGFTDVLSLFRDDSSQFTIFLWLVCSGVLGFARPERPWFWAVAMGPWLSLTYLALPTLSPSGMVERKTWASLLGLLAVSLAVCSAGAYAGAVARRMGPAVARQRLR